MPGAATLWDLRAIAHWKEKRDERRRQKERTGDPTHEAERLKNRLLRIKIRREEASVISVDEHDRYVGRVCTLFRDSLMALARRIGPQVEILEGPARTRFFEDRCRELLNELADGKNASPEEETAGGQDPGAATPLVQRPSPGPSPAAAAPEGERVG